MPRRAAQRLLCVFATVIPALAAFGTAAAASTAPAGSAFVPVTPCRLLDTRTSGSRLGAGSSVEFAVAGRCGVDASATAAALTVTIVDPLAAGFAIVYPAGSDLPTASSVNYRTGQVVANLQMTRLGNGSARVHTLAAAHVVVDVTGYFGPAGQRTGRYVPVTPKRVADTRSTGRPAARSTVRVAADVPDDALAVAVNVTTTDTLGPDFFSVYPAGSSRPATSVLNVDGPGQARAAAAIAPVVNGDFEVYTETGNHVIVDVLGYFTGPSAAPSDDGLFVPVTPVRLVDTRTAGPRLWDRGGREFAVLANLVPSGASAGALALNVTASNTEDAGFVTVGAAGRPLAGTSTVNYPVAQMTVANAAIAPITERGVKAYAESATHLVVDVTGWFTGEPGQATEAAPANNPPADRKVTIITDSAIAGVRWNGALAGLQGFVVDHRMESCRRLVQTSCTGREGYRPRTVVGEIGTLAQAGPEDILVIGTGYDDWWERFDTDFDTVMAAARAKGFRHVAWMTFRSDVDYGLGQYYARMNDVLWSRVASGAYPEVRIWDFAAYTAVAPGWFTSDDIHLTRLGSWGTADYISRQVRAFDDRPCAQPWRPGEAPANPCPNPDPLPPTQGLPDIEGLYY